jgi:hypothetical protein
MTSAWILVVEGERKARPELEGLAIRVGASGRSRGTIWIMAHGEMRRSAAEAVRLISNPAGFASTGLPVVGMMTKRPGGDANLTREGSTAFTVGVPYCMWQVEEDAHAPGPDSDRRR